MMDLSFNTSNVAVTMTAILATMIAALLGVLALQTPKKVATVTGVGTDSKRLSQYPSTYLPDATQQPSKYAYEMFALVYTPIWICLFGIVVVFQLYEDFDAFTYNTFLGVLALPLVLQPLLFPSAGFNSPDQHRTFGERYSTKANLWIAIYSFIGNYWYTHYFYSVLKAEYTMPATRLNNVPLCMFFATHFYFTTYHVFSNALLRKVVTTYESGLPRTVLFIGVVVVFSYFTAFMETLSISSFPYYSFQDRTMAYTVGSAFYGIYFLVSFPAFFEFDNYIDTDTDNRGRPVMTIWETVISSCGYGMIILILLDFVRLYLDIPLIVGTLS